MTESWLFWYLSAFFDGPFSFDKLLFWVSLVGLVGAVILTKKGIGENQWRWIALFAAELLGLVIAAAAGKWDAMVAFDGVAFSARTASILFLILLASTAVVWRCLRKKC